MPLRRRFHVAVSALMLTIAMGAADAFKGTATLNAETVALAFGLGMWNAVKAEVSFGLFPTTRPRRHGH
jgi:hypothetical protein